MVEEEEQKAMTKSGETDVTAEEIMEALSRGESVEEMREAYGMTDTATGERSGG